MLLIIRYRIDTAFNNLQIACIAQFTDNICRTILSIHLSNDIFVVSQFQGHPFMERLRENNFLMSAIGISSAVVVALAFGLSSDLSNTFEIVEFPEEVSKT